MRFILRKFAPIFIVAVLGAVIGGGFIGCELAASLCSLGCKVTLLFPGETIGAGRYPDGLARNLDEYYRSHGVDVRSGVTVVDGSATEGGVKLTLSNGEIMVVEAAAAGLGVTPNVALAERAFRAGGYEAALALTTTALTRLTRLNAQPLNAARDGAGSGPGR